VARTSSGTPSCCPAPGRRRRGRWLHVCFQDAVVIVRPRLHTQPHEGWAPAERHLTPLPRPGAPRFAFPALKPPAPFQQLAARPLAECLDAEAVEQARFEFGMFVPTPACPTCFFGRAAHQSRRPGTLPPAALHRSLPMPACQIESLLAHRPKIVDMLMYPKPPGRRGLRRVEGPGAR
jgi:hypothetical protein